MTYEEFQKENCLMCGTQQCFGEPEDLSYCSRYKGDINGIPKYKSFMEEYEEWMKANDFTYDDLRELIEYIIEKKEE